jgi:alanine dehydrogenase
MRAVRPITSVRVVSRTLEGARRLVEHARALGLDADEAAPDAVAEADIVCACTTNPTPLFDGALLPEGAHVNAVGAYTPTTRELDDATVRRGRLVVETREAALAEAGDLIIPLQAGVIARSDIVADLSEVVRGTSAPRALTDITVFKSVGMAFEDLAIAAIAVN